MRLFSPQVPLNTLPTHSLEDRRDPREYLQREQNPPEGFYVTTTLIYFNHTTD